ncbi:MAG: SDR family NAD(P)-dependent oxidoreductase [Bacteroidota bacterium]
MSKKIILTGGHTGIGLELTKKLLAEKHQIGLVLRNEGRKQALSQVLDTTGIDFFYGDLSVQQEVRQVADQIIEKWGSLDLLFNNAGVLLDKTYLSAQGNEMHLEVNTLAPYLLGSQLRDKMPQGSALTIINTVTDFLHRQKALDSPTLLNPTKYRKLLGAYLQSKLALVLLMNDWVKNQENTEIRHITPGPNKTNMTAGSGMPWWIKPFRNLIFAEPKKGASYLYDAAFHEKFAGQSGIFIQRTKGHPMAFELDASTKEALLSRIRDPQT